jgi:hypothetical protein
VLAAHVETDREGLGPFFQLRQVRGSASVSITRADGQSSGYLLTCGGAYD